MTILVAAEQALLEGSDIKIADCLVTIAMHAQLLAKPREQVLASFLPAFFRDWRNAISSHGNHLRWADGDLLLDFLAVLANGIFLKFSSRFDGQPPAPQILSRCMNKKGPSFNS